MGTQKHETTCPEIKWGSTLSDIKTYVRNLAIWLAPSPRE